MSRYYIFFCIIWFFSTLASENHLDAVHAKVSSKIYFTSDFIDLQTAIYVRICEENKKDPSFWRLVKEFSSDQEIAKKLSWENLLQDKLSLKKSEVESLILVIKLIQILVEQQVSMQNSQVTAIKNTCIPKGKEAGEKIKQWHDKLIFLDDLLRSKANIEKDEMKKENALKSILESLDKQIKHEILIEVQ